MTTATVTDHATTKETIRELLHLSIRLNPTRDHRRIVLAAYGALAGADGVMRMDSALEEVFSEERIA